MAVRTNSAYLAPPTQVLSLCSGIGGLDRGLGIVCPSSRVVCAVEVEAYAAAVLASHIEDGTMAPFAIWSDIKTFDGRPWRGKVDTVTAGYPCQPWSVAGLKRGKDDPRHLWPDVFRIIGEVGPTWVFCENVPGHLRLGFPDVARDLRSLGYTVAAGLFSAEEVGAPHKRERLFILARQSGQSAVGLADGGELGLQRQQQGGAAEGAVVGSGGGAVADPGSPRRGEHEERDGGSAGGEQAPRGDDAVGRNQAVADTSGSGQREPHDPQRATSRSNPREDAGRGGGVDRRGMDQGRPLPDASSSGPHLQPGGSGGPTGAATSVSGGVGQAWPAPWPPGPEDTDGWARVLAVMPEAQPSVCNLASRSTTRLHELRALGNAVCPTQGAYAFTELLKEFE